MNQKSNLSDAARKAKNVYKREWLKKNPERKDEVAAYHTAWRKKNPEKIKQYNIDFWERKAASINLKGASKGLGRGLDHKVIELHERGFSFRQIGTELGISHMKAARIIKAVTEN